MGIWKYLKDSIVNTNSVHFELALFKSAELWNRKWVIGAQYTKWVKVYLKKFAPGLNFLLQANSYAQKMGQMKC